MAYEIKKTEGGHKKGHSNVCHWTITEDIKRETKKLRRLNDKKEIKKELALRTEYVMM